MDGLAPAIAIKQKNQTRNPRSTVATATEIYDYLRLLYARCGTVTCLHCGGIVKRDTVDEIVATMLALPEGTRVYALFPIVRAEIKLEPLAGPSTDSKPEPPRRRRKPQQKVRSKKAPEHRRRYPYRIAQRAPARASPARLQPPFPADRRPKAAGHQPAKSSSSPLPSRCSNSTSRSPSSSSPTASHSRPKSAAAWSTPSRPATARPAKSSSARRPREEPGQPQLRFSSAFECTTCHRAYREPEPRLFSFNNPFGACPRCQGFGNTIDFDPGLIIPDRSKTLDDGAIHPWTTTKYRSHHGEMKRAAKTAGIPTNVPWFDLDARAAALHRRRRRRLPGIRGFFAELDRKKYKLHVRVFLPNTAATPPAPTAAAPACAPRLAPSSSAAKTSPRSAALTITAATEFFDSLTLSPAQMEIAGKVLEEVRQRTRFLHQVGLDYLTLDRLSSTLSGGESQRIQLATSLGSRLVGALYVLDEPSIGLHTRDTAKLIHIMEELRDLGNTILVVEHDPDVIRAADYLLDLGPGAGELGGQLLAAGTVAEVTADPNSITGKYLSGRLTIPVPQHPPRARPRTPQAHRRPHPQPARRRPRHPARPALLRHRRLRLRQIHHRPPGALPRAAAGARPDGRLRPHSLFRELAGVQHLNEVILVDQSPIGRTPRSNPVTYIKAFDDIRALFAAQPDSKRKSYAAGAFSFNVPGGRCDVCEGDGTVTVEMQFLADIELPCEECNGTRYKAGILEIKYKGKNIYDVLNMTVKEALVYFAGHPKIVDKLYVLDEVGLCYVRLGQSATTLSGGEAQRVKLASHLATARSISSRSTPTRRPPKPAAAPSTSSTNPPPASTSTTSPSSSPPSASSSKAAVRCSSSSTTSTSSSPPTGSSTWAPRAATAAAGSSRSAPPKKSSPARKAIPAAGSNPSSSSSCSNDATRSRPVELL